MLNKISWTSFTEVVALILIAYYLYILLAYYRKEFFSFAAPGKNIKSDKNKNKQALRTIEKQKDKASTEYENSVDDSFTVVHELLEDLKHLFTHAAANKMIREELIQAIRSKLRPYPGISETDLVEDINTHIVLEAKDKCSLDISPEDLKQIWGS